MDDVTVCPAVNKPTDRIKINAKRKRKKPKAPDKLLTEWSCNLCPKQLSCKELCPPMDWIVGQVEVEPGTELPQDDPRALEIKQLWPDMLCTSEIIFSLFFIERLEPAEIAKQLRITPSYVYRTINTGKKIIVQNLRKQVQFGT